MKYDIYFHDDFDGRASAAVMLNFLRSRGDNIEHFVPVNFDIEDQYLKDNFFEKHNLFKGARNPAIVVDFLYHPRAAWWFDHHETSFKSADWKKKFRRGKHSYWEPQYKSCCRQVLEALKRDFGWRPPRHIEELARWLDIIDSAQYKSAKQVIEMREPALVISEFIDRESANGNLAWLIKLLSQKSLVEIVRMPRIRRIVNKVREETRKAMDYCRRSMKIFGRVAVVDATKVSFEERLRFMPFYLRPEVLYSLRIKRVGSKLGISFGVNPWRRNENKINIGKFLNKNFGGGGHKTVGGAEFRNRKELDKAVEKIIKKFR